MLTGILVLMSQDARREEESNTQRRASVLGLSYIDTSTITDKRLYKEVLALEELYSLRIIPISKDQSNLIFGITNMTSQQTLTSLRQRFAEFRTSFGLISDTGYAEYMRLYDPPKQVVYQDIQLNTAGTDDLVARVTDMLKEIRPDDVLAYMVQQAHNLNASDIHIESQKDNVRIRFRIDGVLHAIATIEKERYRTFLSVIASAANISTSDPDAQQGHISQQLTMADNSTVDVNVRLETVPTVNGVDVVMRLFNMEQSNYNLDRLGLSTEERAIVDDIINKPSGLVLIVGPTGSGKTTTLYSMLNTLNSDERKIITVEDPVEYQFAGIVQIPVDTNAMGNDGSFAGKLRAILRLDPDIVMVGEIRDNDTAKTALQASLTGHLVLSTFHASSAAAALTRMEDVIGQNPLFVSAIRLVMAQRLIRRLDNNLKQAYQPSEAEKAKIAEVINTLPATVQRPDITNLVLYKPGSSPDNPYGFSGQLALREQFTMNGEIRELLEKHQTTLSAQSIETAAIKSGMLTMLQKGILKVIAGETTLDEVYRVVG
jgi:type II secretory ATPase GspE/PulE/Tfp pilus assembly ATPase PilB-like protein